MGYVKVRRGVVLRGVGSSKLGTRKGRKMETLVGSRHRR